MNTRRAGPVPRRTASRLPAARARSSASSTTRTRWSRRTSAPLRSMTSSAAPRARPPRPAAPGVLDGGDVELALEDDLGGAGPARHGVASSTSIATSSRSRPCWKATTSASSASASASAGRRGRRRHEARQPVVAVEPVHAPRLRHTVGVEHHHVAAVQAGPSPRSARCPGRRRAGCRAPTRAHTRPPRRTSGGGWPALASATVAPSGSTVSRPCATVANRTGRPPSRGASRG